MGKIKSKSFFQQCILVLLVIGAQQLQAKIDNGNISFQKTSTNFCIANKYGASSIVYDDGEKEVISISANLFASDLLKVTGQKISVSDTLATSNRIILIGTIESKGLIHDLIKQQTINCKELSGSWEASKYFHVHDPFPNIKEALIIVGSDSRGAAYGLLQLSREMGVSPWEWWSDVTPQKHNEVYFEPKIPQFGPPSIQYRGIFINDEDWSLGPWVKRTFDPKLENIGPKTYQKVFELMLRLRSNYIWPAMHRGTDPFNRHPENAQLANKYAIICGSSHAEPLLRNNYVEWGHEAEKWNYFTHKQLIDEFWEGCLEQRAKYENIYTIGMRGIHDDQMAGSSNFDTLTQKLEEIFKVQRNMLEKHTGKKAKMVPQVFCPYKEVQFLYDNGLDVPEDVIICWTEDNQGYIRHVPNIEDSTRSGGYGLYYHLSYWSDYLWLSSISPQQISYEMHKAAANGINRLWVLNVGDIKVCEKETEFFMDLAWDLNQWSPTNSFKWIFKWAENTFGKLYAEDIGNILNEYYRLAFRGKPEHLGHINYPLPELYQRLKDYNSIAMKAEELKSRIPESLLTAYIHLVYYPVTAAKYHNDKILKARLSYIVAARGEKEKALGFSIEAENAYKKVLQLTDEYNNTSNGKWKHFMNYHVRGLKVLGEPAVFSELDLRHDQLPAYTLFPEDANLSGSMVIKNGALTVTDTTIGALERSSAYFEIPVGRGDWYLRTLSKTPNPKQNSFSFEIDQHYDFTSNNELWGKGWEWKDQGIMQMDPALYKLIIKPHELNAKIKQVSYTRDKTPFYPILPFPDYVFTLNDDFELFENNKECRLEVAKGLSMDGYGIYLIPHDSESIFNVIEAPSMEFKVPLKSGENWLRPTFLPSHPVNSSGTMKCAVSINGGIPTILDLNTKETNHNLRGCNKSMEFQDEPCLRGYVFKDIVHKMDVDNDASVKISFMDAGLVFFRLEVYHNQ